MGGRLIDERFTAARLLRLRGVYCDDDEEVRTELSGVEGNRSIGESCDDDEVEVEDFLTGECGSKSG